MATWAELDRSLRPRWVLWALLAVLALDVRALSTHQAEQRCARGAVPSRATSLESTLRLVRPTTRSGQDVPVVLRLENRGPHDVAVAGVQAVVVAPAERQVLGWTDPPRPLALVLRPGEYGELELVVHLARCRDRPRTALAPGWYELVAVVTETSGRARSQVRAVVVAP